MKVLLAIVLGLLSAASVAAQEPSVGDPGRVQMQGAFLDQLQQRDSVLIADQLLYGFAMSDVPEGTAFAFPDWSEGFGAPVEVLSPWQVDTVAVTKGRKGSPSVMDIRAGVKLTAFEEGTYVLPPITVLRRTPQGQVDTLVFESKTLEVKTMPVDTATFQIHDIKGQIKYPVTFGEVLPYLLGALALAGIIVLIVWLVRRYSKKGGQAAAHRDPPHIVALRKLDGLRGDKLWAPEKQKSFYSGVTDALREYIVGRYGISAMEMTTKEIFDALSGKDVPVDLYGEMEALFERSDYVKFAKYVATDEENASAVPSAVRFVTQTWQQELDSESEVKEK